MVMAKSETAVRKRILDEARGLFFRYGFSKVTMDETAAGLGMSKKTLYQYFPSKEDLLQAVTSDHMAEMDSELHDLCARKDWNPLEKLKKLMSYVAGIYSKMSEALVHDLRRSAPGIWKQVDECRREHIFNDFGSLIKEGRRKGMFRKDVDEKLFLLIYFHTIQSLLNPEALSGLSYKPSQVFDAIVKVLFEGLLTDKARAEYHAKS
jgi:AcrR family transcriptional regulator